jgi:predicted transcriptional regulator
MRIRMELDDDLVAKLDELACPRGRDAFVRTALERAVRQENAGPASRPPQV